MRRTPRGLSSQGGYTLIELMVSMTIFALVMVAATAAYLSFIAYNRQAQATASVMNSLSYSIDSMTREIRSGTNYQLPMANVITFANQSDCLVTYQLTSNAITRTVAQNSSGTCPASDLVTASPITDSPTVTVKNLRITLRGTAANYQPIVIMAINGYATVPNTGNSPVQIPFQIETAATERLPEL